MADERVERRLAAILTADVVGYTRLMEQDEAGTLARVKARRKEVLEPLVARHQGRIVKLMGDGVLVEFGSAVNAVQCAVELQHGMATANGASPNNEGVILRVGVNLGDVIVEGGDLYGDGVNVAARLEAMAEPGSVCVSGKVYDEVHGKLDLGFEDLGEITLKNIAKAIRVYRVAGAAATPQSRPAPPAAPTTPSIAVLPFANLSGDPAKQYFSDGVTEDVITELSRFRPLLVIARNSSFAVRDKALSAREIGRMLGAHFVVEGSVRQLGDRVRITAQLIDAATEHHLWAERYDKPIDELFAVQDEVTASIVSTIASRLSSAMQAVAARKRPQDMRAYDLFLRGNHLIDTLTVEAQAQAQLFFEKAREIEPGFAPAYTGLAWVHLIRPGLSDMGLPREKDHATARRLAATAVALDPADARAHSALAHACLYLREFDRSRLHFERAVALNPNDAIIQIIWAGAQAFLGDAEAGIRTAERAFRLSPHYPEYFRRYRSRIFFFARRHEEALADLDSLSDKRELRDLAFRAASCAHLGRLEEAHEHATAFIDVAGAVWRGDPTVGAAGYVAWLIDITPLARPEDVEYLRTGLREAGLPE